MISKHEVILLKIIKDIRFFKSDLENKDGHPFPSDIVNKKLNAAVHRVVMKLRENCFTLGDFDHLYVNFTSCAVNDGMSLSKRSVDKYHPWYRFYDVEISEPVLSSVESQVNLDEILNTLENLLIKYFACESFDEKLIRLCFSEAFEQGEKMLMKYKEKSSSQRKAIVYLRYLDSCRFLPLLRVYDFNDNLLFETDLPETVDLSYLGEIHISNKKIVIKPKKAAYIELTEHLCFEY